MFAKEVQAAKDADRQRQSAARTCGNCGWFSFVAPRGRCRLDIAIEEKEAVGWCRALPTVVPVGFRAEPCSMWKDGPMVARGGV